MLARWTLACILAIAALVSVAAAETPRTPYADAALHCQFDLPEGWVRIDQAVVDRNSRQIESRTGQHITYAAGFQVAGTPPFTYPYILLQHHALKGVSLEGLAKEIGGAEVKKAVDEATGKVSDLVKDSKLGEPTIDNRRKMVLLPTEADVPGIGRVKGLSASCPGAEGILQINFYCRDDEKRDEQMDLFGRLLDSVRFDPGFEYRPPRSPEEKIGYAVGVIVAIVVVLLVRRRLFG